MLEVVTVWAPRPDHEKWRDDYLGLLKLQLQSCQKAKHRHVVVTDTDLPGFDTLRVELPENLLKAIISGQLAYLKQWNDAHRVVLLDVDCLVFQSLEGAFTGLFDIGVTRREHPTQPIQNGAIYLEAGSRNRAIRIFEETLDLCDGTWGSDQEALAKVLWPIPRLERIELRKGAKIQFMNCEQFNFTSKNGIPKSRRDRFVFHFKGDQKAFAEVTAKHYLLTPGRH